MSSRQKQRGRLPNGFANPGPRRGRFGLSRRGVIAALFAVLLPVICGFLAYGIDMSMIALERGRLQAAVDAAALAASQEIIACIEDAAAQGHSGDQAQRDVNSIASEAARVMAANVAQLNGVLIDPAIDVRFGKRNCRESGSTETWPITWGETPYNTVGVTASKTFPLLFGSFVGKPKMTLTASAAAFVEARDIVVVLDFSGSMNYDSRLMPVSIQRLGKQTIVEGMRDIYDALEISDKVGQMPYEPTYLTLVGADPPHPSYPKITVTFRDRQIHVTSTKDLSNVVLRFSDGTTYKYDGLSGKTGTFNTRNGKYITTCWIKSGPNDSGDGPGYGERFDNSVANVRAFLGLDGVPYPYPSGSWNDFINYCRAMNNNIDKAGYHNQYGGLLFCDYLMANQREYSKTPDLWKTPHQPFTAVKNGTTLFLHFLNGLEFGDDCGIVSYDTNARIEAYLPASQNKPYYGESWDPALRFRRVEGTIDLRSDPICADYAALDTIQRHRQAAHYEANTGIGAGLKEAKMALQSYRRYGARPTILLMTDGNANRHPANFTSLQDWIPGFKWSDWTDYNDDGRANYTTNDRSTQYAFYEAIEAVRNGYTIHTMSVGVDADREFMRALAFVGRGQHIDVPGGASIQSMEDQLLAAFARIAANVPPPRLVYNVETTTP